MKVKTVERKLPHNCMKKKIGGVVMMSEKILLKKKLR